MENTGFKDIVGKYNKHVLKASGYDTKSKYRVTICITDCEKEKIDGLMHQHNLKLSEAIRYAIHCLADIN